LKHVEQRVMIDWVIRDVLVYLARMFIIRKRWFVSAADTVGTG